MQRASKYLEGGIMLLSVMGKIVNLDNVNFADLTLKGNISFYFSNEARLDITNLGDNEWDKLVSLFEVK